MRPTLTRLLAPCLLLAPAAPAAAAQGAPPGFEEQFALSLDRGALLERLVPGTPDFYYYRCLHAQSSGDLAAVGPLVGTWLERHGRSARMEEIEHRQALLSYDADPGATYEHLRRELGLRFDHQRASGGAAPDLPTRLDPQEVSAQAFRARALAGSRNSLSGFTDAALPGLVTSLSARDLNDQRLTELLKRLERPDVPGLVPLVLRELGLRSSGGFGSLPIHGRLLLEQLEECAAQRPALLEADAFIAAWVRRLKPGADVNWEQDPAARGAYLERLAEFTARLAPAHNTLKAHVLYHRLAHDLAAGAPDKGRFMEYLRLPRQSAYVEPEFLKRVRRGEQVAQLGAGFPTGLDPVGDDEALVRAYFTRFLVDEDSIEPYASFVRRDWLERLFAETKILAGRGDMERWYSLIDSPSYLAQLERRVELDFAPEQRVHYRHDEEVVLAVDVKNVETLLVNVYEIDTVGYHTELGREVDASIELDGLVPNAQTTYSYGDPPLRRVRRTFALPELDRPGTWVVDLIGGGLSSRAVVHKGGLRAVERVGSAGHVFRVVDSAGAPVPDAAIRLGAREFAADEAGEILVPFTTDPGEKTIVLRQGTRSSLARFRHLGEELRLSAGVFVERESLLDGERARLIVRPTLEINGRSVDVGLLEAPRLRVVSSGRDGAPATLEVGDLELGDEGELVQEIRVPEGLRRLEVSLHGELRALTSGEVQRLASPVRVFELSGIDATPATYTALLGRTAAGYVLDVLGKNGEPRAGEPVRLELFRAGFSDPYTVTLQTDAAGRVRLGALEGLARVRASGAPTGSHEWPLVEPAHDLPRVLHGRAGTTLRVPYQGRSATVERSAASLIELRDGQFARDRFDLLALRGGFLELRALPAGDYDLWLPEDQHHVLVRVTDGPARGRWAFGRDRYLELGDPDPLQIVGAAVEDDALVVRLANAGADARVHVATTRYLPAYDLFARLLAPAPGDPERVLCARPESSYHAGRAVGDEYRYILERRLATVFPGNMLSRPSLLLNPWAFERTDAVVGVDGGEGGKFGSRVGGRRNLRAAGGAGTEQELREGPGVSPDLGFLPAPATLLANLRPDADGVLRVPLADLGPGQHVHVLAVDRRTTVRRDLALEEQPLAPRDRRLAEAALDPERHVIERRRLEVLDAGAEVVLSGGATTGATPYDSLDDVHRLYRALTGDEDLARFAFLLRWPGLSDDEKRALYGEHACHELHVFLHQKDRAFFDRVVRPYLANKRHRTFIDAWLLGEDLSRYRDPWAFAELNLVEQILLTRRLAGERAAGARLVRERFELLPPDPAGAARLFDAALGGDALAAEGASLMEDLKAVTRAERPAAPGGPATPGPAGPTAGGGGRARGLADKDAGEADAAAPMEEAEPELYDEPMDSSEDARRDLERRKQDTQLWRALEATEAYVEHEYWHRRRAQARGDWIPVRGFWLDFAETPEGAPFRSPRFAEPTGSTGEMLLALAFLDLPFEAPAPEVESQEGRLVLRPGTATLLVRRELADAPLAADAAPLLLSQDLYRFDDRFEFVDGERRDKFVRDEFLIGVAYGCRVVLTNPTSTPRELELLVQIPAGALPVNGARATRGLTVRVDAYGIATHEYAFYFPAPGRFPQYPAHAAHDGELIAFAAGDALNVVAEPSAIDTSSWEHVTQEGSPAEVLAYLAGANPFRIDLARPAWRLRDRGFYDAYLGALRARHLYDETTWSYGVLHRDAAATREYLRHQDRFVAQCGRALDSPLLRIDPVERLAYQHVEYSPLVNPRAHTFAGQREILDQSVKAQWARLVTILAQRPALDAADWMSVTYYLLLQDRVAEALESFGRVEPTALETRLQYDYFDAYLDFFSDQPRRARGIAERYADHPVPRWRALYRAVLAQLDEAEGRAAPEGVDDDPRARADRLAAAAPALELQVDGGVVTVSHANLEACTVSYTPMDVEFLFSTNPFVQQGGGSTWVRPARSDVLALDAGASSTSFPLPADLARGNMLVEVRAGGLVRRQAVYVGSLDVQVMESFGQLRVTAAGDGRPRAKVYVKVYARTAGGEVRFHKDGYTDHRGRFDYASMTGPRATDAARYALLVLDEEAGAAIREVDPPTR